jgi:hypothetical protein
MRSDKSRMRNWLESLRRFFRGKPDAPEDP